MPSDSGCESARLIQQLHSPVSQRHELKAYRLEGKMDKTADILTSPGENWSEGIGLITGSRPIKPIERGQMSTTLEQHFTLPELASGGTWTTRPYSGGSRAAMMS